MPLPAGVETVTVSSGQPLTLPDGTWLQGRLIFTGPDLVTIGEDDVILGGGIEVPLVDGQFTVTLCATDATNMSPTGWTYTVAGEFTNAPDWTRYITLPKATPTVKLADVVVPDPVVGTFTVLVDPSTVSGGSPASSVVAETSPGQTSAVGTSLAYARGDHTHGTPAAGTTAGTFAAGNDARLSDARTPTGAAGGDLSGTYPNPAVGKVNGVAVSGTPSSGQVLTATGASAASWQTPSGGGGGGATIRTADTRITAGDVALSSAGSWTIVTSGATQLKCSITAAVGDRIQISPTFMRTGSAVFLDLATLTSGGAISRYVGSGTSTPLSEGNPGYYPQSSTFPGSLGTVQMVVASGEVDGSGNVSVALVYKGSGPETIYASATYPWYMLLTNIGPEPA